MRWQQLVAGVDEVVAEQDGERLVPDVVGRAQHGVPEAERLALADVVHRRDLVRGADAGQAGVVALGLQDLLELDVPVEMVLDVGLAPAVTIRTSVRPAAAASSTTYWIAGVSMTGSISFGIALVAGTNLVPRPAPG